MCLIGDNGVKLDVELRFNVHYTRNKSENAGQARSGKLGPTLDPFLGIELDEPSGWLSLPLAAAGLGNLIDLQPVQASEVGKEKHVVVR